jgi:hypothetical protein
MSSLSSPILEPLGNPAVMGASPSSTLAKTVTSVAALGRGSLRCCRAVLGALYRFSLAINIRPVVGAFRLRFLLVWLSGRWLRSLRGQ